MIRKYCLFVLLGIFCLVSIAFAAEPKAAPCVKIETTLGDIVVELDPKKAPKTVSNFLFYVKSGFYTDTIFHRVINGFMIQGGGLTADMKEKPNKRKGIQNESNNGLSNLAYTIAMARTRNPHSATSQFFINVVDNPSLDHKKGIPEGYGYAVFGKVISGQDVVDQIKNVPTKNVGIFADVPETPIVIKAIVPVVSPLSE